LTIEIRLRDLSREKKDKIGSNTQQQKRKNEHEEKTYKQGERKGERMVKTVQDNEAICHC